MNDKQYTELIKKRYLDNLAGLEHDAAGIVEQQRRYLDVRGEIVPGFEPGDASVFEIDEDDELEAEIEKLRIIK